LRLNIVKSKNALQYYVIESYRTDSGKNTSKIIEKLGSHAELIKTHEDPEAWARAYVEELNRKASEEKDKIIVQFNPSQPTDLDAQVLFEGGYIFLQKIFYELRLDYICRKIAEKYKFTYDLKDILAKLIYGRILFPTSKCGTAKYAETMLENPNFDLQHVYRALTVLAKETDYIQQQVYKFSNELCKRNDGVLYYDCTNFFFEIEAESGIRKYGYSKEHRPNPIVQMGMFIDGDGIPLAFTITDGNTNEQITLKPLEKQIIDDFGHSKFVVCTDAGLSSVANRKFNDLDDRGFITTQPIKKMKDFQKEWALDPNGWHLVGDKKTYNIDDINRSPELRNRYKFSVFYKESWFNENDIEQRYIVSYSIKYADYQKTIRDGQVERASRALSSKSRLDKTRRTDFKRFIGRIPTTKNGEVVEHTTYYLKSELIEEESKYDGFYAVATNLEDEPSKILKANSGRWEIEECFRIMKTEFKSRPAYVSRDDHIKAHFLSCFLALVVYRYLEKRIGHQYTCEDIISGLKSIKFLKIKDSGYIPAYTRTEFTNNLHEKFGFRTDFEMLSKSKMKNILSQTKKK